MTELLFLEALYEEFKVETYKGFSVYNMERNELLKLNTGSIIGDYLTIKKIIHTLDWNVSELSSVGHLFDDMKKEGFMTKIQEYLLDSEQHELLFSIIEEGFNEYKDSVQDGEEIADIEDVVELHNTVFEEFPDIYADILINWFRTNRYELNK